MPEGTLALSRCAFEYAEAPELRLVEAPTPSLMSVFTRGRWARSQQSMHAKHAVNWLSQAGGTSFPTIWLWHAGQCASLHLVWMSRANGP